MTFKDTLTSDHLPVIPVSSVATSGSTYSRSWQFSTLHPWLEGRFIVTFHQETIFVLDVFNGKLVGACTFQEPIRSIAVSGGVLYMLLVSSVTGKSIVRVSVHHSFMPVEMTLRKPQPISTSNSSTPYGSTENLLSNVSQENEVEGREKSIEKSDKSTAGVRGSRPSELPLKASPSPPRSKSEGLMSSSESLDSSRPPNTMQLDQIDSDSTGSNFATSEPEPLSEHGTAGVRGATSATGSCGTGIERTAEEKVDTPCIVVTSSTSPEPKLVYEGNTDDSVLLLEQGSYYKCEKPRADGGKEGASVSERAAEEEARDTNALSKINDDEASSSLEAKPMSLTGLGVVNSSSKSDEEESIKASLSENEKLRWQRMAEASFDSGGDIVADKPKKKKKKGKGKKLSPVASKLCLLWCASFPLVLLIFNLFC